MGPGNMAFRAGVMLAMFVGIGSLSAAGPAQAEGTWAAHARALAVEGQKALAASNAKKAAHIFDEAIAATGMRYQKPGTIDDTRMKFMLSEVEAQRANWDVAADLKAGVVEARLSAVDGR